MNKKVNISDRFKFFVCYLLHTNRYVYFSIFFRICSLSAIIWSLSRPLGLVCSCLLGRWVPWLFFLLLFLSVVQRYIYVEHFSVNLSSSWQWLEWSLIDCNLVNRRWTMLLFNPLFLEFLLACMSLLRVEKRFNWLIGFLLAFLWLIVFKRGLFRFISCLTFLNSVELTWFDFCISFH